LHYGTDVAIHWPLPAGAKFFNREDQYMLRAAIGFFVLAIIAILLGASGVAGISMEIGRTLLLVFLILAVISFVVGIVSGKGPRTPI